jgi:hypothetical protein
VSAHHYVLRKDVTVDDRWRICDDRTKHPVHDADYETAEEAAEALAVLRKSGTLQ